MRPIDADALLAEYDQEHEGPPGRARTLIEKAPTIEPERKKGKCVWCDSPFRIEYYWIDREGCTASFQDKEGHVVATGIANFCPNCGADIRRARNEHEHKR